MGRKRLKSGVFVYRGGTLPLCEAAAQVCGDAMSLFVGGDSISPRKLDKTVSPGGCGINVIKRSKSAMHGRTQFAPTKTT